MKNYINLLQTDIKAIVRLRPTLQEYFFRLSLLEIQINSGDIKIDHKNGKCWHSKIGWVSVCFPINMINRVRGLAKQKKIDYYFRGVITNSRSWLTKYPNVCHSDYGRDKEVKYGLDVDYYENLNSSYFGLSPVGDCPWSYRFFESVMCKAIPILGDDEVDNFSDGFFFFRDSDAHFYDAQEAEKNYKKLIDEHTLYRFSNPLFSPR